MRKVLLATTCLALAACSQKSDTSSGGSGASFSNGADGVVASDVDSPAENTPGISTAAAPGVAFAYRYAFRMPTAVISHMQDLHVRACEKLGVAHCRVTGMHYRLVDTDNVAASLAFALDPALARSFGSDATAAVTAADGKLANAEVDGNDAGAAIKQQDARQTDTDARIRVIDGQLTAAKLSAYERERLREQRATLVATIGAARRETTEQQDSFATTPVLFDYASGPAVQGFDPATPLTGAANLAIGSAKVTFAVVLGLLATLGPPGLVMVAGVLLWRRFRPRPFAQHVPRPDDAVPS